MSNDECGDSEGVVGARDNGQAEEERGEDVRGSNSVGLALALPPLRAGVYPEPPEAEGGQGGDQQQASESVEVARATERQAVRSAFRALASLYRQGKIAPLVWKAFPLENVAEALGLLGGRQSVGKIVLTI